MLENENIDKVPEIISTKYRDLNKFWYWIITVFIIFGVFKSVDFIFDWRLFGLAQSEQSHYYLLLALFVPPIFLLFPPKMGLKGVCEKLLFLLDTIFFLLFFGICLYLSSKGFDIVLDGWSEIAPTYAVVLAVILWVLILEAIRRTTGTVLLVSILLFSLYPVFAEKMPYFLEGIGRSFNTTITYHIFSTDGTVGMMMQIFANIVIGFIAFGTLIDFTGGGEFFLNIADLAAGKTRGGPAKVSIIGSALFGSLSGSVISNVIVTGNITIPTMKRSGYPADYAAAIECCASTGGAIAPPVMGAVAFIMASFLGISYVHVALAAVIPTLLFYLGLFVQADAYAAKNNLHGKNASEIQPLFKILKKGWYYLPSIIILIYYLFYLRRVYEAPWVASLFLLAFAQLDKEARFTLKKFLKFVHKLGKGLSDICTIMAGVGMIIGAFAITGIAVSLAREMIIFAGGNVFLILILGAITSFILGMGMPIVACYVFLSIVLAPALIDVGLEPIAVHLFILYCGLWSFITPPVALATFPASVISGASPLKIGLTACRLGGVIFLIPFLFVLNPSLLLRGSIVSILLAVPTAMFGVFIIGSAFEGYMCWLGRLWPEKSKSIRNLLRFTLVIGGILLMSPGSYSDILGILIILVVLFPMLKKSFRSRNLFNILG